MLNNDMLYGMRIIERAPPPVKLKLSAKVAVGREFRANFDRWLALRFGYETDPVGEDQIVFMPSQNMLLVPYGQRACVEEMVRTEQLKT